MSIAAALIITESFFNKGYSNKSGAPIQRTGSPVDGNTSCNTTSCHTGSAVMNMTGWITSNIPVTGYVTGNTYTVTATATSSGLVRYGFEISPQSSTGALAGTIVITNSMLTRLAGASNPKYITHTTLGTDASAAPGSKTWTFNWTAPAISTGMVTFYGAFNCANNNTFASGDLIRLSTLQVSPDLTSGWSAPENKSFSFDVFPNPASENIFLSILSRQNLNYTVELVDVSGKTVKEFYSDEIFSGIKKVSSLDLTAISSGIYFLRVKSQEGTAAKKIIVL